MVLEAAIIADDLTGAADTGVQFRRIYAPVYQVDYQYLPEFHCERPPEVLSVFTSTRALPGKAAQEVVASVAKKLKTYGPKRVYKKIDSCMRGNVGWEADALLESFDMAASFIAPAIPVQGRTTVHGQHLVKGVPVSSTEMGRDPVCPVPESSLTGLISSQSRFGVGHIHLELLEEGPEGAAAQIDRLLKSGVRNVTFDAVEQFHLDLVANLALVRFPDVLLVGSAGLAQSLVSCISKTRAPERLDSAPPISNERGHLLLICGSASESLLVQVETLLNSSPCKRLVVQPEVLASHKDDAAKRDLAQEAAATLDNNDLVIQIGPRTEGRSSFQPETIVKGLADMVGYLVEETVPGGLFLSGGDTATAVLGRLEAHVIRLDAEITDGLVRGMVLGGPLEGRLVVVKPGAFGPPDVLLQLYRFWSREGVRRT